MEVSKEYLSRAWATTYQERSGECYFQHQSALLLTKSTEEMVWNEEDGFLSSTRWLLAEQHPRKIRVIQKLSLGHRPLCESDGSYKSFAKENTHSHLHTKFCTQIQVAHRALRPILGTYEPQTENSNTGRGFTWQFNNFFINWQFEMKHETFLLSQQTEQSKKNF